MATVFAMVNIPKEQLKGSKLAPKVYSAVMEQPKYETEIAVTQAIVSGELSGFDSFEAYDKAKRWQKHLKTLQFHPFRKGNAAVQVNGKYNHVMFQRL